MRLKILLPGLALISHCATSICAQEISIATFAADVTPPIGSPLCDGLVLPARKIVDRLSARGIAIFGKDKPIVLCAVDWVGIGNTGHDQWRRALAAAVETTVDRVCVHALHPHDAPGCDFASEALLVEHGLGGKMFPVEFARTAIARTANALKAAVKKRIRITHFAIGKAKVEDVASNRRILGKNGKVAHVRFSKCGDPKVRAMPEGVIDPWVRVVGFFRGEHAVAALSYYATHPQSYYGSGGVSCDFVGLARNRCDGEIHSGHWVHFNGAGGNVAAGKYNDGNPARRAELTQRLADGMSKAWREAKRFPIRTAKLDWRTVAVALPPSTRFDEQALLSQVADSKLATRERVRAARDLVWFRRTKRGHKITLACLSVGKARILHLPGELFVEYQIFASKLRSDLEVCTAAYGDYGPGYIGTKIAYSQGGYETGRVSRVAPEVETVLRDGIQSILMPRGGSYRAGTAVVKITPTKPVRLAGYASRTQPSSGVLQDVHAKALALVDPSGKRALLLTADLLGVTKALADAVCQRLGKDLGLPRSAIMIATSHTHTAPALTSHLAPMFNFTEEERVRVDRYTEFVEERFVDVAKKAFARLAPAKLHWAVGECGFAVNRRNNNEAKVLELRAAGKLKGPFDHDVPVLRVTDPNGKLRAVVFGYACHCTVLSFRRVSGDYAGFAQSELEQRHEGAVAMFVAGCGGDQNPLPRRDVKLAKRYGAELAKSVDAALTGKMTALTGPLHTAFGLTPIPFDKVPTKKQLQASLEDKNVYRRRHAQLLLDRLERDGKIATQYPYPVQAWRLGDELTWVALGGEVTVDYSLAIKKIFGGKRTWVAAYCNDVMGYIPSHRVWREGGYEGGGAMLYYGQPSRWAESVETVVMAAVKQTVAKTLQGELPRIPPKTPEAALQTFRTAPSIRVELVAAEPDVVDPIDMEFDEHGNIWVIEMRDYPFDERDGHEPTGRVRVLEDIDGDGRVDKSRVFADKLSWPTAIACWKGGVFVASAPHIYYLKDENGDGRADRREIVFSGFGRNNVQTLANNFVLQPDGWFYGAGGGNGGKIVSKRKPNLAPVLLRGRDFRFHPDGRFESLTGGGQFGHTIDDFGRRFVCNNSDHARHIVLEQRYVNRNPLLAAPSPIASIAVEGGSGPVFRLSPPEPWRIVRTRLRIGGQVRGPIEHGGAVSGYFTSATGITVYRGNSIPGSYGNLIVGDVASNLIHRKKLTPNGVTFRAARVENNCELLASSDIWFRPVNFANGPDGALYVCDMYREVVEHPWSLPDEIKSNLDLMSGSDRGRIWRIAGANEKAYRKPNLGSATGAQLVAALLHRDGWQRDTAMRLLLERQGASTGTRLRQLLARNPAARTHAIALALLAALHAIDRETIEKALTHGHPGVRETAVRLLDHVRFSKKLTPALVKLSADPDARVRFQLACTLGMFDDEQATRALMRLAVRNGADHWTRAAILSSVGGGRARRLLEALQGSGRAPKPLLHELCAILGASQVAEDRDAVATYVEAHPVYMSTALLGLADGMRRRGESITHWLSDKWKSSRFSDTANRMRDTTLSLDDRLEAIRLWGLQPIQTSGATLFGLLDPKQPPKIQAEAVRAIASHRHSDAAELLLAGWPDYSPTLRQRVLDAVTGRTTHHRTLSDQLQSGRITPSALAKRHIDRLRRSTDPVVRRLARKSLGGGRPSNRAKVIDRYRPALAKGGDADRGRKIFETNCIACHRRGGKGTAIGPDIETVRERTPAALLEQILDPSREVNPAYLLYVAETKDQRILAGSIVSETDAAITLQQVDGKREVLLRTQIESLKTSGLSLMPVGLESTITPDAMADLIAFLRKR
jgi:putative membrane-bound dehydrogenase-like protein